MEIEQREREREKSGSFFCGKIQTFVETKLLFDLSTVHIPHHSRLWEGGGRKSSLFSST